MSDPVMTCLLSPHSRMMSWSTTSCRDLPGLKEAPRISDEEADQIAQMLNDAKRPLILAGRGVTLATCGGKTRRRW